MNRIFEIIVSRVLTKTNVIVFVSVQNILSIFSVFSSPIRIPPRTSIGLLTGISILLIGALLYLYKKKKLILHFQSIDLFVYMFVVANALSLIFSQHIFDITNFRLLLSAVVQYTAIRFIVLSEKEKLKSLLVIGWTTVVIGFISLFQLLFREQAIILAQRFLFGDAAYSIARDLARGRGAQWGNIIITFPFFMYMATMMKNQNDIVALLFRWLGIFLVPFSFIVSNFRGLTLCFLLGMTVYAYYIFHFRYLSIKKMVPMFISLVLATSFGIGLASFVFQYNLIDRFLFKEKSRDIQATIGRIPLYKQAVDALVASPIFGVGLGNYRYEVEHIQSVSFYNIINGETGVKETEKEPVSSHNDVLTILAESGIFGIITYGGILYFVIKKLWTLLYYGKELSKNRRLLLMAFFVSIGMYFLSGMFENTPPNNIVYLFFLYAAIASWT